MSNVRAGDPVAVAGSVSLSTDRPASHVSHPNITKETSMKINYVNLYVSSLEHSLAFFRDTLGVPVQYADTNFGYASLDVGPIRMALAQIDSDGEDQRALVGRQTGIGFATSDLARAHQDLAEKVTCPRLSYQVLC